MSLTPELCAPCLLSSIPTLFYSMCACSFPILPIQSCCLSYVKVVSEARDGIGKHEASHRMLRVCCAPANATWLPTTSALSFRGTVRSTHVPSHTHPHSALTGSSNELAFASRSVSAYKGTNARLHHAHQDAAHLQRRRLISLTTQHTQGCYASLASESRLHSKLPSQRTSIGQ